MRPDVREGDEVSTGDGRALYRVLDVWPNDTVTLVGVTARNKTTVSIQRVRLRRRPGGDSSPPSAQEGCR